MDDPDKRFCSCKSVAKFCLIYLVTLQVLLILFTALTNESLNREQLLWYWIFLVSLLITTAFAITALTIILCSEYYSCSSAAVGPPTNFTPELEATNEILSIRQVQSPVQALTAVNSFQQNAQPLAPETTTTSQRKGPSRAANTAVIKEPPLEPSTKFVNLTPTKNPVTVVDVPAMNAKKKVDISRLEDANLAAIPTNNLTAAQNRKSTNKRKYPVSPRN